MSTFIIDGNTMKPWIANLYNTLWLVPRTNLLAFPHTSCGSSSAHKSSNSSSSSSSGAFFWPAAPAPPPPPPRPSPPPVPFGPADCPRMLLVGVFLKGVCAGVLPGVWDIRPCEGAREERFSLFLSSSSSSSLMVFNFPAEFSERRSKAVLFFCVNWKIQAKL